ncbi:aspartate aminotransferase family protein [Maricurvus nonylphenolicus]
MLGAAHTHTDSYDQPPKNIDMIKRRQAHLGGSILFYHEPVHIVRGEGVWLYDAEGKRYLDCYNNVASVGHCHPKVVAALTEQAATLNTHTRYLHENVIDYAEELTALMPDPLSVCMFVCSGTEANELAMRIARTVTGKRGAIVMENSYHGNSTLIDELSTVAHPDPQTRPAHVVGIEPPNTYRGPFTDIGDENVSNRYANLVDDAIDKLENNGEGVAAFMCDTIFDTQGSLEAPKDYFKKVYHKVRQAGGLCIADEVQPGLCRTGKWWGFEHYDVIPDIVTLGKPMGDGHPLAIVVTSQEIAERFSQQAYYFNTFGGNPVSCAVGRSVLHICKEEKLVDNCHNVGAYFRKQLEILALKHPVIGDIRGKGLFLGIELVKDRNTKEPYPELAAKIPDAMKQQGILMGMTGRYGNMLKVRPPLIFKEAHADLVAEALDRVLTLLTQ